MKKLTILFTLYFMACLSVAASELQDANRLYQEAKYSEAARAYNDLLSKATAEKPLIYYNLGNTYYKLNNLPQAILCYRRAYTANPCDADVRSNMNQAMAKVEGNVVMSTKSFLWFQYERVMHHYSWEVWAIIGLCFFIASLVCFMIYRFYTSKSLVRIAFSLSICFFALSVVNNCLFLSQYFYANTDEAVVMKRSDLRATPNTDDEGFKAIEPGTVVRISKESRYVSSWSEIWLPSGERGWIATSALENI